MSSDDIEELWKKYQLTKEVLRSPLELTQHEDAKTGRILAPIAFLTAAATTLFALFLNNNITWKFNLCSLSYDLIILVYQVFISLIVIGTIFMLEAFGPYFEIPKVWRVFQKKQENKNEKQEPESLFFFAKIASMDVGNWTKYFDKEVKQIILKACKDHVFEAYLVSKKVRKKINYIRTGKYFFYLAMIMLLTLAIIGTIAYVIK